MSLTDEMRQLARQAKQASRGLAKLPTNEKNGCLIAMAAALENSRDELKRANQLDLVAAAQSGLSSAMLDRLRLESRNALTTALRA